MVSIKRVFLEEAGACWVRTRTPSTTFAVLRRIMSLPPNVDNNELSVAQSQERESVSMYVDTFWAFRDTNQKSTSARVVRPTRTR